MSELINSLPAAVLVGLLLGVLSGLGVGGGSLLVLWLTLVLGTGQQAARSINLLFFIPSALVACIFRWKQGALEVKTILPAILAGSAAAGAASVLAVQLDTGLLKKLFGILLLAAGLREILYRPRKAR